MKTQIVSKEVATLYNELRDCIRANNKDRAKRVYRELSRAGRPLSEILGEVRSVSGAAGTTTSSAPEEDHAPLDEWLHRKALAGLPQRMPDSTFRTPDPPHQSAEPTIGSDFALERSAPTTAGLQPQRDKTSLEKWRAAPSLEETTSDPSYQRPEGATSSVPGGANATNSEPERDNPPLDKTTRRSAQTALERITSDLAPQISSRAIWLGIEQDPSPSSIDAAGPARRARSARLAVAVVAIIAIASVGWVLLPDRALELVAVKTAPPSEVVITAAGDREPTGTEQPAAAAGARTNNTEHTPEIAPATPTPVPAASSPDVAPAAPGDLSGAKPDATPVVAKLEVPENASPSISASPDAPSPATVPTALGPADVTPPSEPRASTAETAALLARGDSLFGVGDVTSARLFYKRAADAGDGQAALRLGETYDPSFLERARLRAVQGDSAAAVFWYQRARDLGIAEAEILTGAIMAGELKAAGVATTTGPSPESAGANLTTAPGAPPTGAAPIVADRPSAIRPGVKPPSVALEQIRRHARYGNRSHYSDHRSGSPSDDMARQLNAKESGQALGWRGGLYDAPRDSPN
jgi:hypothetical protein